MFGLMDQLFRSSFDAVLRVAMMAVIFHMVVYTDSRRWAKVLLLAAGYGQGALLLGQYLAERPSGFTGELTLWLGMGSVLVSTLALIFWLRGEVRRAGALPNTGPSSAT